MNSFKFFADKPLSKYRTADSSIIILTLLMWGIGMFTLYFSSGATGGKGEVLFNDSLYFVKRQFISSMIGFVLMFFLAVVNLEFLKGKLPYIVLAAIILCLCVYIPHFGISRNGARRWIRIPLLGSFQPSEAVKLVVVLYLAKYFDWQYKQPKEKRTLIPGIISLFIFTFVVLIQKDFSTSVFVFALGLSIFFVSGARLAWMVPALVTVVPLGGLFILLDEYRLKRIIGFINPDDFQNDLNYQITYAKRAIMNGGLWGQGFGSGLVKTGGIPEVQSDYIFAGWVEATGFVGVIIYMALLALFTWRCMKVAMTVFDRFMSLMVFGFVVAISGQSLLNLAVVASVLPSTGVPLPFFSSGGSSIMVTLGMCGLIINASRFTGAEDE